MKNAKPGIVAILPPEMRARLDALTARELAIVHADSIGHATRARVRGPVVAVMVWSGAPGVEHPAAVRRLLRRWPGALPVAVLGKRGAVPAEGLLALGAAGVRRVFDLAAQDGATRLRRLLAEHEDPTATAIKKALEPSLASANAQWRHFFELLVQLAPTVSTMRAFLPAWSNDPKGTLQSRFFRAKLPSAKAYLAEMRLVYAAALLEDRGNRVADVARQLRFSSPQTFGRIVRLRTGRGPQKFRGPGCFQRRLEYFMTTMVNPYTRTFRRFDPLEYEGGRRTGR